jgi:hypothetical protein
MGSDGASRETRALVATMVVAAFVAPLALIGALVAGTRAPWLPATGTWALAMLAIVALATPNLRARLGPRGPLLVAFALIGFVPIDWAFAATALAQPIVEVHWRCGTGDVMLLMILPFLVAGWSVVSVLAGTIAAGRSVGPRMERALRRLALAVTAAGVVVVGYGGVRARLPEPDRWIETRPIVAKIAPNDWTGRYETRGSKGQRAGAIEHVELSGAVLYRHCDESDCGIGWKEHFGRPLRGFARAATIVVKRDVTSGVFLFADAGELGRVWAIDEGGPRGVTPRDVGSTLGPPRAWLLAAALGVVIAAALLAGGAKLGRGRDLSLARLARVREGELEFADGERWPAPRGFAGREHEVVTVLVEGATPSDTFRHTERPRFEALAGTPDELAAGWRATRAAVSAFALAALVTLATPLVTALAILIRAG